MNKPDFFIVGAPKSGTTAMDHYLGLCPDIFMPRKEMNLFGADLHFGHQFYRRNVEAYLAEFDGRNQQRQSGEASVWYLFSKTAAAEIKAFNPDARIIIMLRNPVELLYSLYHTFCWDGNEYLSTFEEALAAQDERKAGHKIGRRTYFAQGLVYREVVKFAEQVKRYFDTFGRDRVKVIIYDDFAADVQKTCRDTLGFLGVDSSIQSDFRAVNSNKFVRNGAVWSVMNDPMLRAGVIAVRPLVPRFVFRTMQKVDAGIRKLNSRTGKRAPLSPELRRQLQRQFAPEIERLSILLERDLSHWCYDAGHPSINQRTTLESQGAVETVAASQDDAEKLAI